MGGGRERVETYVEKEAERENTSSPVMMSSGADEIASGKGE